MNLKDSLGKGVKGTSSKIKVICCSKSYAMVSFRQKTLCSPHPHTSKTRVEGFDVREWLWRLAREVPDW